MLFIGMSIYIDNYFYKYLKIYFRVQKNIKNKQNIDIKKNGKNFRVEAVE
jgi:hypothetical protein